MSQKIIAPPLGLIDPNALATDESLLINIKYEMFPDETVRLYKKSIYLVVHTIFLDPMDKCWCTSQDEFPLCSLPWIIDRFENGFFKPQKAGGLSDFDRSVSKEFEGELIGVSAMAHCCAENLPGFNIWNANRASYIDDTPPQQWDIPRIILLEQGLLASLKGISAKYQAGQL
jgi:hypothetical protein